MQLSLTTLELRNNKLQQDLAEQSRDQSQDPKLKSRDKSRDYEERIERLQVELEKKTSMLMEVRRHLHEAVEREKQLKSLSADPKLSENYLTVVRENEHLQHQVAEVSSIKLVKVSCHDIIIGYNYIIESVDSISRDGPDTPIYIYI